MIEPTFIKRGRYEFGFDLNSWSIGFNFYRGVGLNVFIGPFRFQVHDHDWVAYSEPNWTDEELIIYLNKSIDYAFQGHSARCYER